MEQVSWEASQQFIQKLNDLCVAPSGYRFSLPTEAQWEYACRADTTTPFHLDKSKANYGMGFNGKTTRVGSYPANAWGLYDMHGNVWEWCGDCWHAGYPAGSVIDPVGPTGVLVRGLRGGCWSCDIDKCSSVSRINVGLSSRNALNGVRLSLELAEQYSKMHYEYTAKGLVIEDNFQLAPWPVEEDFQLTPAPVDYEDESDEDIIPLEDDYPFGAS